GMAGRAEGEAGVWAGGAARREDPFCLPGERHGLLRRGPEAGGGEAGGIIVLALRGLPRDDDKQPAVLVVTETKLTDRPFWVAGVGGRQLDALRRRPQTLSFEELADADHQPLDLELLPLQHH